MAARGASTLAISTEMSIVSEAGQLKPRFTAADWTDFGHRQANQQHATVERQDTDIVRTLNFISG